MIYFYDNENKYIGARELQDSETMPAIATTIKPTITDGKQARFINGKWVISDIPAEPIIETVAEPTTEEVLNKLIEALVTKGVLL